MNRGLLVALTLLVVGMAGCAGAEDKGGTTSTSSTSSTVANGSTTPPPTATGLPIVTADGERDIVVSLTGDNRVHRMRIVAFEGFTLESVGPPGQGGGFGGGGGGGASEFGLALFAPETGPAQQAACSDAGEFPAWDGRTRSGNAEFEGQAGIYDLWVWSGAPTTVTLELNGGGAAQNVTAQPHNWTATVIPPTITKSGPAQTTANFDQSIPVSVAALILGRYVPPSGYPDESMSLIVQSGGATCAEGRTVESGFGAFSTQTLLVSSFVGAGDAVVSGRYTATASPTGEGAGAIVALQPN